MPCGNARPVVALARTLRTAPAPSSYPLNPRSLLYLDHLLPPPPGGHRCAPEPADAQHSATNHADSHRAALDADSRRPLASKAMIRTHGPSRRNIAVTEDELEDLAAEFAEYAAQDIADLLQIDAASPLLQEIALEVAHAIRCTIDELPHAQPSPSITLRHAATETLTTPSVLRLICPSRLE